MLSSTATVQAMAPSFPSNAVDAPREYSKQARETQLKHKTPYVVKRPFKKE